MIVMERSSPWARRIAAAATACGLFTCGVTTASSGSSGREPPPGQTTAPAARTTVWGGVYSAGQAKRGEASAGKSCAKCHGADLTGGQDGPSLVGPEVLEAWSSLTLADLFDRIKTTMPADAPQTLGAQEAADILAYTLSQNKCPAGEKDLPADAAALAQIRITSRPDAK